MNMIRIASALTVFLTAALSLTAATTWDHKVYKLLNVNSGKALDVEGYSLDLGADIQQWTDGGTTNQKWYLMNVGNGTGDNVYQALGNVNSGYALDVRDWSVGNNFNGQAIQQWWKHGYYTVGNEQFQLYHLGSGRFNLISYASGKYLAVDGASTSNGAIIVQYASSGGNEQKWDLYEASHTWSTPSYSPSFWNDDNNITLNNNCYNYANNRRNDSYAQPGVGGGLWFTGYTQSELEAACNRDQLNVTTAGGTAPNGQTKIVMYIGLFSNGLGGFVYDFHLWRKDSNGMWSHKPGGTNATNLHTSGGTISDPASLTTAQRGGYDTLIGYFFTPSDSREGRGHGNVWGPGI